MLRRLAIGVVLALLVALPAAAQDLSGLVGWCIIDTKTISGRIDSDGNLTLNDLGRPYSCRTQKSQNFFWMGLLVHLHTTTREGGGVFSKRGGGAGFRTWATEPYENINVISCAVHVTWTNRHQQG